MESRRVSESESWALILVLLLTRWVFFGLFLNLSEPIFVLIDIYLVNKHLLRILCVQPCASSGVNISEQLGTISPQTHNSSLTWEKKSESSNSGAAYKIPDKYSSKLSMSSKIRKNLRNRHSREEPKET